MKYKNITLKKYQIIKHIINKYAESHDSVTPIIDYDKDAEILDISGISRPISFNTESIGIIPKGAYEVVGQVIRSKTSDGHVDVDGMNVYDSAQRIFNIANDNRQEVFDFISANSKTSYCSCCGTNRDRSRLFYIRRVDIPDCMYQVGSSCIKENFDTSYFDLMKEISNVIEHEDKATTYQSDYNLIDYLALYCVLTKTISNAKTCCKKVVEILDTYEEISDSPWADKFMLQKSENFDKITAIAKFYSEYPNYARDDNAFAIKTVQSMAEMLKDNIDVDPYYSKSNCLSVAKMYLSLLPTYISDYYKYTKDLFKYNAYLVETSLTAMWDEQNRSSYKLRFNLDGHVFNISLINSKSIAVKNVNIVVPLDNDGNMINESKAKSTLLALVLKINESAIVKSQKSSVIDSLNKCKEECISRYSNFNPSIVTKYDTSTIKFLEYSSEPLVISIADDIEQSKSKLSTFINTSYVRQDLSAAYKEFSKKYIGKSVMACMQPKQMNIQFSCEYVEKQFRSSWPESTTLTRVSSHVDSLGKNVVVYYNKSKSALKMPVNSIGIVSGADYDIGLRIRTFIAKELDLPMPKFRKEHVKKTDEDIVKARPKKNVTRLFSSAGTSARNLVMVRKVNVIDDASGNTLGVSVGGIGKILFSIENGNAIYQNEMYTGRITLDGHTVSDGKRFDKKTLSNAVHALEYLVYLSDEDNNLICNREVSSNKSTISYTYKYDLNLGKCKGSLQFRIIQNGNKCSLKYGPKFIIEKDETVYMINLNFNEDCWKNIQTGLINLNDIQRGASVLDGQKNTHIISGAMWINRGEPQKITNEIFTELTGISI